MMTAEHISCLSGDNDLLIRIPVIKTDLRNFGIYKNSLLCYKGATR